MTERAPLLTGITLMTPQELAAHEAAQAIVTAARRFFDEYVRATPDAKGFPWMPADLRDALVLDYATRTPEAP